MKIKLKICEGCKQNKVIYKRIEGKPYCKYCASLLTAPKKIKPRSKKKIEEDKEYSILRIDYLEKHPYCEINTIRCTHVATEIHHTNYRIGENYLDTTTWKSGCSTCHKWCHAHPKEARELGHFK